MSNAMNSLPSRPDRKGGAENRNLRGSPGHSCRGGQPKVHAHADRYQLRNRDPRLHGRLCGTVRKRCHQRRLIPRGHSQPSRTGCGPGDGTSRPADHSLRHARFRLSALSGDKYPMPELPFPDDTLPVSGLRSLARNTLFAVAEDGVPSPPMKCVRLHVGPDGLKASASNGFCIMEADGDKQCKGRSSCCCLPDLSKSWPPSQMTAMFTRWG